ncbi:MAG TPA: Zn-dependent hydrolase [Gemmatimonadales bacterium]|nr:Zn-dependent hydrolase [Gemmatimonadales bacterium]
MNRREFVHATAAIASGVALRPQQGDWKTWRVNGMRVNQHLTGLSQFGANPQGGVSRVAFSDADIAGRRFMMDRMRDAGLNVSIDPVGNIIGVRAGSQPTARPILFGSHIDSVPEGGNYDGDVGSCGAIEVAHTLADRRYSNRHPLHVVIWCDEESGLTGSRGYIGDLPEDELRRPGRDSVPLADKIRRIGGDPARIAGARHGPGSIAAYLELHIEQGGILDERGLNIGIVEGIVGIHHYDVTLKGFANHAGTTPMDRRRNAMLAAAEIVLIVDRVVRSVEGRQVGTVGRLLVKPGAPNVVPGQVDLTVELRDLSTEKIERLWSQIHAEALAAAKAKDVTLDYTLQHTNPPALSTPAVRAVIAEAVRDLRLSSQLMPSGAGHDAQDLARIGPMGMIFVPSVNGISHAPLELTRPDDVTNGANVLLQTVLRLDQT